ncbi:MAG: septal ring lytic transglycosylase RlpA family protein [Candidatus Aceula meridiana]|nr:septal ring lytic transglycosylase RlpA family protein [Candidatus Aceula meridiana]
MKRAILLLTVVVVLSILPQAIAARTTLSFNKTRSIRVGRASWYSRKSPGIKQTTANNEIFDDTDMTCAIWGPRFNRKIRVTNLENNKSIIVRVNDRGPSEKHVLNGRIIDLTKAAFDALGTLDKGLIDVEIEFL